MKQLLNEMFGFMVDGFLALRDRVGFWNAIGLLSGLAIGTVIACLIF